MRESEVIRLAVGLVQNENANPEFITQVLNNLMVCIKNGNCDLPMRNFR